jgi:hypothetical protein
MKKLLIFLALVSGIVFGINSNAHATKFYVTINISDGCTTPPNPYTGNYAISWKFEYNGSPLCSGTYHPLHSGTNQITFECDVADQGAEALYTFVVNGAARYPSGNCANSNIFTTGNYSWDAFTDGTYTPSVVVTL